MSSAPAPLRLQPVRNEQVPFLNQCYTYTAGDSADPTMIWGTQIDMTGIREFLTQQNKDSDVLVTPIAVLVRAVGLTLKKHPEANCRLIGSRIYQFSEQNVLMPVLKKGGPALRLIRHVDRFSYAEIARQLSAEVALALDESQPRSFAERVVHCIPSVLQGWCVRQFLWFANHFRMPLRPISQHLNGAPVMINYFGFPCAPPLISYKASRFGSRSILLNITLGPAEPRPVVVNDAIVIRPMAGLFVRMDHRTLEARQMANFVKTLVTILELPQKHDQQADLDPPSP